MRNVGFYLTNMKKLVMHLGHICTLFAPKFYQRKKPLTFVNGFGVAMK